MEIRFKPTPLSPTAVQHLQPLFETWKTGQILEARVRKSSSPDMVTLQHRNFVIEVAKPAEIRLRDTVRLKVLEPISKSIPDPQARRRSREERSLDGLNEHRSATCNAA